MLSITQPKRISSSLCATLSPAGLAHAAVAIETARAGGIGILDAVHAPAACTETVLRNLHAAAATPPIDRAAVGLRLTAAQAADHPQWLAALAVRPHWVLLDQWTAASLPAMLTSLASPGREIWLEVGDSAETHAVAASLAFAGWAARGAECGGHAGRESSFVLAQRLAALDRPFLVRGGIGLHSAAACAAAGAHGVILDDVVLLLRESPLPPRWRHLLAKVSHTDTVRVGSDLGHAVRVIDRHESDASRTLKATAEALSATGDAMASAEWMRAVGQMVAWGDPADTAWPIGEASARASAAADRYRTVARLVRAVQAAIPEHLSAAARLLPLATHAPLAQALGTRVPIVQGPMTRVSDTEAFAAAVAGGGGLPMLALALLRGPDVASLLTATAARLEGRPWGVGILGFVPNPLRQEQLAAVRHARPPFALIAGGRPDQAADLEAAGIGTFLHVPAPLLPVFLAQGARRFVFEGGECGGHVGPLHSFALWDYAVDTLIERLPAADAAATQVLFAGGIHDDRSAAMVSALAAPLAAAGVQVGALMGTAYLFTEEAVACGAITPGFQHEALTSETTATIETGPGHVIRCAATPFIDHFARERQALAQSGLGSDELSSALDQLVLGRSRIASKGLARQGDRLVEVDAARQHADGLFMLGQVAACRDRITTIAALHTEVSDGSTARLQAFLSAPVARVMEPPQPADVAIVGMACLVPGARDPGTFWRNVLDRRNAITEIPRERWDYRLLYDARAGARDRVASKWGGFVDAIGFDPTGFGIPPNSLRAITPPQLLALEISRRALIDAGYADARPPAALRERTAVVFAVGNTGDLEQMYMARAALPLIVGPIDEAMRRRLPEWTEESYPGLLANVVAGRVANRFDLGGPNLTTDAACASSLAALDVAVREVADGRSDMALAGGFDFEMSTQTFMGFSHTRALSPRGRADVFDRGADGIVIAEGGVAMVLKRLADAERDGDRVYGVIKSVAASSDGRGLSMTAPKSTGQSVALDRAYARAGVDPASLGLYEAHGTGTALGDAAETETLSRLLRTAGSGGESCAVGSVKSLVGHTRIAAGMVALMKAVLSLHHRVLPPHAGVTSPLPAVAGGDQPMYLLAEATPWLAGTAPRRAGASAFGFGGTNYHAVVEEHRPTGAGAAPGATLWPCELFVIGADDRGGLHRQLDRLDRAAAYLAAAPNDGRPAAFAFRDLAYVSLVEAKADAPWRAAMVATSLDELRAGIRRLKESEPGQLAPSKGVFLAAGPPRGDLAFVFPGQGSQHPGMGRSLALYFPELRESVDQASQRMPPAVDLARRMWPAAAFGPDQESDQQRKLSETAVAQPAIGALSCGCLDVALRLGLRPSALAGHSFGELVALHAAGSLDRPALVDLAIARGQAMAAADAGAMAMLPLDAAGATTYLDAAAGVVLANINGPSQVVISGPAAAVEQAAERARADGHHAVLLPVSGAFHSPLMRAARASLAEAVARVSWSAPAVPVYGNADGAPYPAAGDAIAARLCDHLEQPVNFVAQIESMYAAGVRVFLELGPGRVMTGLVRRILGGRPAVALACGEDLRAFLDVAAALFIEGQATNLPALHRDRDPRWMDLDRLPEPQPAPPWWIDGGHAWPAGSRQRSSGVDPFLTVETALTAMPIAAVPDVPLPPPGSGTPLVEFYREYEQTMRRFLDQQERMLGHVLGMTEGAVPVVPVAPQVPLVASIAPAPIAPAGDRPGDRGTLLGRLVRIVGDRTGYTEDAIGTDLDLEADLGIDSIKRIEVITTFAQSLPEADGRRLQTELDRLTRLRTLGAIADASALALGGSLAAPAAAPQAGACDRFVIQVAPGDGARSAPRSLHGLHLLIEDRLGVSVLVAQALREAGAIVVSIPAGLSADADRLAAHLADATARAGRVRGLIDLAALGRAAVEGADDWWPEVAATTGNLFRVLKPAAADLDAGGGVVVSVTALGGRWGRDPHRPGAELAAGCHGLLRSFAREYPDVRALVVDVDESESPDAIARQVIGEFLSPDDQEAGWRGGRRFVPVTQAAPIAVSGADAGWRPQAGWVVVATGGARGVTAEVCHELAAPGVRFVLIGRPRGDGAAAGDAAEAERDRAVSRLRAAGAEVELLAVDVGDPAAFGQAIDDVYRRYGRIDGVLHGAGVINDQRFELKPESALVPIFRAKVGGAWTLARHLKPEGLRWVVLFGSVSGRFGNPGQTDYAAANEVLNRLAWRMSAAWPDTRVRAINWGPWRGLGMMSESTLALVQARGIHPITPEAGRRFVLDELSAGANGVVEVIAGHGPWASRTLAVTPRS